MIPCEICGNYYHADDIEECPNCGIELCPKCYGRHVGKCLAGEEEDDDYEIETTIPHICPNCRTELELDIDWSGTSGRVICPKCDFVEELSEEQLEELNQEEEEDEEEEIEEEEIEE